MIELKEEIILEYIKDKLLTPYNGHINLDSAHDKKMTNIEKIPTISEYLEISKKVVEFLGINMGKKIIFNFGYHHQKSTYITLVSAKNERTYGCTSSHFPCGFTSEEQNNKFFLVCYVLTENDLIKIHLNFDNSFETTYIAVRTLINLKKEIIRVEILGGRLLIISSKGFESVEYILFDSFKEALDFEKNLNKINIE